MMHRPRDINPALHATLQQYLRDHDKLHQKGREIFLRTRVQDFVGASYTLTMSRDKGNDAPTYIEVDSTWPRSLQVDAFVVARLLMQNSPSSLSVAGSDDSISVSWVLSSEPYLVQPHTQRSMEKVKWMSKLRFWVLSARLQQSLGVWVHTPQAARPTELFVHPRLPIVTVPEADEFHTFLPVETTAEDAPVQHCLVEALTQHMGAPLSCSLATRQDVPPDMAMVAGADVPLLRVVLPRAYSCNADVVATYVRFIVFFPDIMHRWLVDSKMVVKRSMREFLERMRRSLEP
eukprot:jgi/Ulvmu1/6544/UM003_0178.1